MRFPRQAKIFRGQLDVAPVAGVVFLLLIFMQLSALLYTPGVLVQLKNPAATIWVEADGRIRFGANFYTEAAADAGRLRAALRNSPAGPPFDLRVDPAAPPKAARRARDFINSIFPVQLPAGPANLLGTDNPTVRVAVNFLGQYFFDNALVGERELEAGLIKRVQAAQRESKELTLTVTGDEQVNWSAVTRLAQLAREAGIKDMILAEWTEKPSAAPARPVP